MRELPYGAAVAVVLAVALGAGLAAGAALAPAGAVPVAVTRAAPAGQPGNGDAAVLDVAAKPRKPATHEPAAGRPARKPATRRPAVPLTSRFPTITGQTVDPGSRVLASIPQSLPLPARSGVGRRIVYGASAQHLWVVDESGAVIRDYPVTGRIDRPGPGRYRVYSKSAASYNPIAKVTFSHMVRFAHGVTGAAIGFHSIPRWANGKPLQTPQSLGLALGRGGCIRQTNANAADLYRWVKVGDRVVVVR